MTPTDEIAIVVREAFLGKPYRFRPCAVFDERLDCIRVIASDCSVTEVRVDNRITVLEDNHPKPNGRPYVGFTIKGARHFCKEQGLSLSTPVRLADILDRILAASPNPIVGIAVNMIARPLVEQERIESVDLSYHSVVVQTA